MPYIKTDDRPLLDKIIVQIPKELTMGELNYLITKILLTTEPQCYIDYNALVGVLECVKLELYRRAIAKYENKKITDNGDVY